MTGSARGATAGSAARARARLGVSLFFFLNGFLLAGILTRLPEVKGLLGLGTVEFGFILAAIPAGSIGAAALPAPLIRRFGAAAVASVGTMLLAGVFVLVGAVTVLGPGSPLWPGGESSGAPGGVPGWVAAVPWIAAGLIALAGFLDAVADAAQNVHGLAVEQERGSLIFNSLHAIWSVGSVSGGGFGLLAAALHIPLWAHLSATGALGIAAAAWAWRLSGAAGDGGAQRRIRADDPEEGAAPLISDPGVTAVDDGVTSHEREGLTAAAARDGKEQESTAGANAVPSKWTLLAGVIALGLLGAFVEDLGMNWSSLYFSEVGGVGVELAGIAFVVALSGQLIARFSADALTARIGRTGVVLSGGVLVTAGMLLAMAVAQPWAVVVGFFLSGFGSATFIPTAYGAAGTIPGFSHGMGITLASWALRIAMLASSPVLGLTAGALGLRYALVVTVVAGLGAVALAMSPVLRRSTGDGRG